MQPSRHENRFQRWGVDLRIEQISLVARVHHTIIRVTSSLFISMSVLVPFSFRSPSVLALGFWRGIRGFSVLRPFSVRSRSVPQSPVCSGPFLSRSDHLVPPVTLLLLGPSPLSPVVRFALQLAVGASVERHAGDCRLERERITSEVLQRLRHSDVIEQEIGMHRMCPRPPAVSTSDLWRLGSRCQYVVIYRHGGSL